MRLIWSGIFLWLFIYVSNTWGQTDSTMVVPFTLSDKIRLIRIEEQMNTKFHEIDRRFEQIDKRFEQIDKRLDRLEDLVWAAIFALLTAMIMLIGFILWDRRTFLKPINLKMNDIENEHQKQKENFQNMLQVLKEKAKEDDTIKELLKKFNLW